MADLVALVYPDEQRAAQVVGLLGELQKRYLIELEDVVYVTKDQTGKVKLHQTHSLTGVGLAWGGFWGLLVGLLFFIPIGGLIIGMVAGAIGAKLSDFGIDDKFAKELGAEMTAGSSAILMLIRRSTADKAVPELAKYGGKVMYTSLSKEAEAKLQKMLEEESQAQSQPTTTGAPTTPAQVGG